MNFSAPSATPDRARRLRRWALLWLSWIVALIDGVEAFAPMSGEAKAIAHRWLDRIAHVVLSLAIARAAAQLRPAPRRRAHELGDRRPGKRRAIVGSRLRRRLRHDDLRLRIARLSQAIDTLAATIVRRLPRGLTRRSARRSRIDVQIPPYRRRSLLLAGWTLALARADTS